MRSLSLRLLASAATIAVAFAIVVLRPDEATPTATPSATFTDGDFTHSNSRDGMPVLTAAEIGPGNSVDGTVTIANTGTLGGYFSLSARDVDDAPGPGGAALSERLRLRVTDVAAPAPAYDGPLTELDGLPLGHIAPGDAHTYAIVASLPHGASDNLYAGSSTSVRLVWDAIQDEPPSEPGSAPGEQRPAARSGAAPAADRSVRKQPLRLTVRTPRVQRFMQRKRLLFRAWCNRPCRIATRGTVRVGNRTAPLRTRLTRVLRAGVVRPRVRLPRGLRSDARRLLDQRGAVVYELRFSARDRAGRRVVVERRLVVRERGNGRSAWVATAPIGAKR